MSKETKYKYNEPRHLLSKYSYKKGDGNQEASGVRVSIHESRVCKSNMSHMSYSKLIGEIITAIVIVTAVAAAAFPGAVYFIFMV